MSAPELNADVGRAPCHVAKVPEADTATYLINLSVSVQTGQKGLRRPTELVLHEGEFSGVASAIFHNGALELESQSAIVRRHRAHSASSQDYDDNLHALIEELLWKSNVSRNQQTLEDLKLKAQQKPVIRS